VKRALGLWSVTTLLLLVAIHVRFRPALTCSCSVKATTAWLQSQADHDPEHSVFQLSDQKWCNNNDTIFILKKSLSCFKKTHEGIMSSLRFVQCKDIVSWTYEAWRMISGKLLSRIDYYRYVASITEFAQQMIQKGFLSGERWNWKNCKNNWAPSTLWELWALACLLETSLLPFNNTGVSRQQTFRSKRNLVSSADLH
jgi:hypothetical protein